MTVCRGCGGDGVGQHVSVRERQIIDASSVALIRHRTKFVHIGADPSPDSGPPRLTFRGPLAHVLVYLQEQERNGWQVSPHSAAFYALLRESKWACEWCAGTGVPQLSVHALQTGASR